MQIQRSYKEDGLMSGTGRDNAENTVKQIRTECKGISCKIRKAQCSYQCHKNQLATDGWTYWFIPSLVI